MTLLNVASDGNYPLVISLYRYLFKYGATDREDLTGICSVEDTSHINNTIRRWTSIGLFSENGDLVHITDKFLPLKRTGPDDLVRILPSYCRELILEPRNCQPLLDREGGLTSDFVRGISWLLAQNIYDFPKYWDKDGAEAVQNKQISEDYLKISNSVRWTGLRFWARYLGFASGDSKSFFVDPTEAIVDVIPSIFSSGSELTSYRFVEDLAAKLPVLDFGSYRVEIERKLDEKYWKPQSPGCLSMSLSFALRRLELSSKLAFDERSDAEEKFTFVGRNYREWRKFTHVRLLEKKR